MNRWIAPALVVALLGVWLAWPAAPPVALHPGGVAPAFHLKPGTAYRYRLVLQGEKSLSAPTGEALAGRIDFDVEVELRAYRSGEVGLRFGALRTHALVLLDQPVLADAATAAEVLGGREARLTLNGQGVLTGLRFEAADPATFKHLAQLVAQEMAVTVQAGGSAWAAREVNQHGVADSRYQVVGEDAAGVHIRRVRSAYHELLGQPVDADAVVQGEAELTLAPAGHVVRLKASEHAQASEHFWLDGRVLLELIETAAFLDDSPRLVQGEVQVPGEVQVSEAALRKAMEARAAGLTAADLLAGLATVDAGGALADRNRWLWRASGLLRLQPALADELAARFVEPEMGHAGRALTLDLLVSVGHARAQAAVRRALTEADLSGDPQATTLYNRLGFIERPEPATVDLVAARLAEATGEDRVAWAYTLGAVAGHEADPARARALAQPLVEDLAVAETPEARRHLLRALGNAGQVAQVPVIARHMGDPDPHVRKAVAGALRKCDDPESAALLGTLLVDEDPDVQQAAARALGRRPLDPGHLSGFAEAIEGGRIQETAWPELLDALNRNRQVDPDARRAVLEAMLARPIQHPGLRARLRSLLAG